MLESLNVAAITIATALIIGPPIEAKSQDSVNLEPWFHCDNRQNAYMVPSFMISNAKKEGFKCQMLDVDKQSSKNRACFLKRQLPGKRWSVYNPESGRYSALNCSNHGSEPTFSRTPTVSYGTWSWIAHCPSGTNAGHLTFEEPRFSGDTFSGSFSSASGGGNMSHGKLTGNSIRFVRNVSGQIHTWVGTLNPTGKIITGGSITKPPHEICTFSAVKR